MARSSDISERHEIRIEGEKATFVFQADSTDGKLVIRQLRKSGGAKEKDVCSLTLADPEELEDFFEGLRRVLRATGSKVPTVEAPPALAQEAGAPPPAVRARRTASARVARDDAGRAEGEREEIIERARQRNAKAFAPWSRDEEERVRERYRKGESVEEIARTQGRSSRAIALRLQRLGEDVDV